MASLNLSTNGPSIKSSYAGVVNGNVTSNSPTHAQWALFSVQAPLVNAFQDSGAKESVLKVESTGDGELTELNEDFNEGRIQFAFVKVKDPNTALPKYVLIAWCGGGVPERTKGYFTSHLAAVSKVLHGYHVQITARSDTDLDPASIMQKVADASGAKYSAGSSAGTAPPAPPPVKSKPVFSPTSSSAARVDPLVAARSQRDNNVDADGWGSNAPPVTRTQIEKVAPAYQPTKVNMAELTSQKSEPSRFAGEARQDDADVIKGGYKPVGKVDIAAIRAQAQKTGDDRPTPVKGSYEPVGKVDIAAIRAKAQKPVEESQEAASLADRAAAFSQPQAERLTSLPKPKVAKKFAGAAAFTGTKAPTPGLGFGAPAGATAAPLGGTSRTFADQGGKTPAQIWAEKKARERGESIGSASSPSAAPVVQQKSGSEWRSGYTGKTWAPVQTSSVPVRGPQDSEPVSQQNTGEATRQVAAEPDSPARGGVSALRDQFKNTAPIGAAAPPPPGARSFEEEEATAPPPPPPGSRPGPAGGFALPGLPSRPPPVDDEEEEDDASAFQPPAHELDSSPIRVAAPVARGVLPLTEELPAPPPMPPSQVPVPKEEELQDEDEAQYVARSAAGAVAEQTFDHNEVPSEQGGKRAIVQYDYEKAEDNEIDLVEGQYVNNIDMVDEDWWMGTNAKGESGLFPSNYVELVDDEVAAPHPPPAPVAASRQPEPEPELESAPVAHDSHPAGASSGPTATALYDYEAAEDNELSFPEDAKVTNLEFPDEDWWFGHFNGQQGLFPANYVQLDA
ncbi:Drebrin-like protein [Cladobotryum mycophilum]|uniref:Drebrin-like protein n=1 Tax=Cladobotryum mycophilum TaxID=491253 RepID=A0ABR0S672_9HYPO